MVLVGIPLFVLFYSQLCLNSAQTLVLETSPGPPVYVAVHTKLVLSCTVNETDFITLQWVKQKNNVGYLTTSNKSLTSLVFDRVKYSDQGIYYCRAINQTSGLVVAQTNTTVNVGDPPPKPPPPAIKRVCGYPPTELIMSYQYTSLSPTHYPVTVELIIFPMNACFIVGNYYKVVEESRRVIQRPRNCLFEVNIGEVIKQMVPDFPDCGYDSPLDCSFLCTRVRTSNAFGTRFSDETVQQIENKSGEVADFRAIDVGRNHVTVGWGLPRCLRNSTQWYKKLNYWIWCEPACGNRIMIPSYVKVISGLNYTISSLMPYKNYTFYASSSFSLDHVDAGKPVSVSVRTEEGVPKASPVIETMTWLSECTGSNGTAVVSWKVNEAALLGIVRYYIISYQVANSSSKTTRKVTAGVHRLVVSGLHMDKSYRFSVTVCTGGGCSEASPYYSLSSIQCPSSDASRDRLNVYPIWIWITIGASVLVVFVITVGFAVFKKPSGRVDLGPGLPTEGIYPTAEYLQYHPEGPIDFDYACADRVSPLNGPASLANGPEDLRISTACLSRSSSVLTCSTEI